MEKRAVLAIVLSLVVVVLWSIFFAPGPLPSRADEPPVPEPVRPTREHERAAAEIAAGIEDENLRESVQKAVSFSLAKPPSDRSF